MWAVLGSKALRWLGHCLVYLVLTAGLLWSVYVTVIRPHTKPTPTERAEIIVHNECKGLFVFGCGKK